MYKKPLRLRLFPNLYGRWLHDPVSFSYYAKLLPPEDQGKATDPEFCAVWMKNFYNSKNVDYCFGGYMEDRTDLFKNLYHEPGHTIHVGIDYYVPVGTQVCLPDTGKLISLEKDPENKGGWGAKAIYQIGELYVIFAHLTQVQGRIEDYYPEGSVVGFVGDSVENGGWYPHLHVQCLRKYVHRMNGYFKWFENMEVLFPNPEIVL